MSMIVKNNVESLRTLNVLNQNSSALQKSLQQVSTGMKLNSAKDDASAYSISDKMRIQIRGLEQCSKNVKSGQYLLTTAMSGLEQIKTSLERMAELADQSSDAIMTDNDRATVQKEFSQLRDNITDIAVSTDFNGQTPLHPIGKPKDSEVIAGSQSVGKAADIVFLVDTTSSMADEIKNVASNVETFTNSLTELGVDYRIAIESFNDSAYSPATKPLFADDGITVVGVFKMGEEAALELNFTDDGSAVSNKLTEIADEVNNYGMQRGVGGYYEPESGLEGVKAALNLLQNSRDGAAKQIIVITDATFHDSNDTAGIEPGSSINDYLNASDVVNDLKSANVRLSAVTLQRINPIPYAGMGPNAPSTEWGWLVDATGGENLDLESDNYGAQLTLIAQGTAEFAESGGGSNTQSKSTDSIIEWRNILRAENGFSLGSAFVKDIFIHTGDKANQAVKISLYDHIDKMLNLDQLDLMTRDKAVYTREALDIVIQKMLDQAAEYGALSQRLETANANIETSIENIQGAESRIRDADMAKAMLGFTKNNVLVQASQSMLAQANQSSNDVIGLLQ